MNDQPPQGPPSLFRRLLVPLFGVGAWAILRSARQVPPDQWGVFSGALLVLAAIGLCVGFGFVLEPEGMKRVVFGRFKGKPKAGRDDDWSK